MADTWDHIDDLGWRRLRWSTGFLVVAGLFTGSAWFVFHWTPAIAPPPAPPPAAVMIDLAPMPAAPPAPPTETPPGPQQTISQPPPPEPEVQQPLPEAPPSPAPEVAVPVPPKPKPKPVEHRRPPVHRVLPKRIPDKTPPAPETTAPPQVQAAPAPASAPPPAPVASSAPPSNAIPTWQGQLMGRLEQSKRYPPDAQYRGEQGVAYLHFSMDRNGKLLAARIQKSSGYDDLDAETLALIHRAEPLPKPPPEVPGDPIELTVPIQFFLHGRR